MGCTCVMGARLALDLAPAVAGVEEEVVSGMILFGGE